MTPTQALSHPLSRATAMLCLIAAGTTCGKDAVPAPAPAVTLAVTGEPQNVAAGAILATSITVEARDASGRKVSSFTGLVSATLVSLAVGTSATLSGTTSVAAVNGVATFSDLRVFVAGGGYQLAFNATDLTEARSAIFAISSASAVKMDVSAGQNQAALPGAIVIAPRVKVSDAYDNGVGGVTVTFSVTSGGGFIGASAVTTSAAGLASAGSWTLGTSPGTNTVVASAPGLAGSPITFTASGTTPSQRLDQWTGSTTGVAGFDVPVPPTVQLKDPNGAGIPGKTVTFRVQVGDGSITGATAVTDQSGLASVGSWTLSGVTGSNVLLASVDGLETYFNARGAAAPFTASAIAAGDFRTCGISSGAAYCWGWGGYGANGDGTSEYRTTPVAVATPKRFFAIASGWGHTCGIATDSLTYCWGHNFLGALGDGTTTDRFTLGPVHGTIRFVSIAAGYRHTCGLEASGTLWCWGSNWLGALGDGSFSDRLTPSAVPSLSFDAFDAVADRTCGVAKGGTAYCWGANNAGEAGFQSNVTWAERPTAVTTDQKFTQIAAGLKHSCGLTVSQQVYCWGSDSLGQLGSGAVSGTRRLPIPIASVLLFTRVAVGDSHSCALSVVGDVYCWGNNKLGQLGTGNFLDNPSPTKVRSTVKFTTIVAREDHTCALAQDGVLWCWGSGQSGQLGDWYGFPRNVPGIVLAGP